MTPWLTEIVPVLAYIVAVVAAPVERRPIQVPEELLIRLQAVYNASQFLERWINHAAVQRAYLLQDDDGPEVEVAQPAGCVPEMQTVEFDRPYDPSLIVWPTCTRVRRCGGCCSSTLLHCAPTRKTMLTVKVIKARYPRPGADKLDLEGYENIRLEQHERCACQCRQTASDCGPLQRYEAAECRCICRNQQEAARCEASERYWDSKECACLCRHETDCSTGSVFNSRSCRCEPLQRSPVLPDHLPGPAPHLHTPMRDDGGENDAFRLRYAGLDTHDQVGAFALSQYKQSDRTILLGNASKGNWTEQ